MRNIACANEDGSGTDFSAKACTRAAIRAGIAPTERDAVLQTKRRPDLIDKLHGRIIGHARSRVSATMSG